jgi:hypothetical protein
LDTIAVSDLTFHLKRQIQVAVSRKESSWVCEAKDFSIFAFGESEEEAMRSFREDFATMWEVIGQSPDDSLTDGAIRVKRALLSIVESVERRGRRAAEIPRRKTRAKSQGIR